MPVSDRLSLQELTDAAGVSVRTVRYYIAEGLLPAPMGSGPASFYTPNHLRRLRLIGRLKEAYLPLKEIRRRLEAVPDGAVPGLLALADAALFDPATWEQARGGGEPGEPGEPGGGALRYIDRVLARQRPRVLRESEPIPFRTPAAWDADGAGFDPPPWGAEEPEPALPPAGPPPARPRAVPAGDRGGFGRAPGRGAGVAPAPAPVAAAVARRDGETAGQSAPERWRRIALGSGAELLVSEEVYERLHGKVEWLVRQARRVFG